MIHKEIRAHFFFKEIGPLPPTEEEDLIALFITHSSGVANPCLRSRGLLLLASSHGKRPFRAEGPQRKRALFLVLLLVKE